MGHYDEQMEKYEDEQKQRQFTPPKHESHRCIIEPMKKHSHYHKNVSGYDTIDVYVICDLYVNDNSGCIQHAVKKLLCCGNRGVKDNVKDLQEAIDTIQRKIEILQSKSEQ